MKNSKIFILLEESHLKYYITGLILSDGHISKNRLRIRLSIKDKDYLLNIANILNLKPFYIKRNEVIDSIGISIMNKNIISKYVKEFDINSNKTKYPPKIDVFKNIPKKYLISLLIGFIDGDGQIKRQNNNKGSSISIKLHNSWLNILKLFQKILDSNNIPYIDSKGYCILQFGDSKSCSLLKKHVIKYNLPVLKRKWNIIDENFISRIDSLDERELKILKLYKDNLYQKDIGKMLNLTQGRICQILKSSKLIYQNGCKECSRENNSSCSYSKCG